MARSTFACALALFLSSGWSGMVLAGGEMGREAFGPLGTARYGAARATAYYGPAYAVHYAPAAPVTAGYASPAACECGHHGHHAHYGHRAHYGHHGHHAHSGHHGVRRAAHYAPGVVYSPRSYSTYYAPGYARTRLAAPVTTQYYDIASEAVEPYRAELPATSYYGSGTSFVRTPVPSFYGVADPTYAPPPPVRSEVWYVSP